MATGKQDVTIGLGVDDKTKAGLNSAQKNIKKTGKEVNKLADKFRNMARATAAVEGPLGGTAGRLSSIAAVMGSVNLKMVAFGITTAALSAVMVSSLKAFSRWESQTLKVNQLLNQTGYAAGITADEIEQMSIRIGRDTLASADDVRSASAVLLSFKSVGEDAFGRTLVVASDLAAITGQDLKQSVIQLGKALDDPATGMSALRRSGISFTNTQKDMIVAMKESGDVAGAQAATLALLEGQLGGAGKAAGSGLAGAADLVSENWNLMLVNLAKTGSAKFAQASLESLGNVLEWVTYLVGKNSDEHAKRTSYVIASNEAHDELIRLTEKQNKTAGDISEITRLAATRDMLQGQIRLIDEKFEKEKQIAREKSKLQKKIMSDQQAEDNANKKKADNKKAFDKDSAKESKFGDKLSAEAEKLRVSLLSKTEQEYLYFSESKTRLDRALEENLISQEEHDDATLANKYSLRQKLIAIDVKSAEDSVKIKDEENKEKEKADKDFWKNMESFGYARSKKLFKMGQVASIANAVMEGHASAMSAYKVGMKTGPWTAVAYAAASTIATGIKIQKIKSASPPGKMMGGSVIGGRDYLVGEAGAEVFTPATSGSIINNKTLNSYGGASNNVNLVVNNYGDPAKLPETIIETVQDWMNESGVRFS